MKAGTFIVFKSEDEECREWQMVKPDDVPDWVKDPRVMGMIARGEMASYGGAWYRAELVADCPIVMPEQGLARV